MTTEFKVFGLSGRDGGSEEGAIVLDVEDVDKGAEVVDGFEDCAAASAVILVVIPWFRDEGALVLPAEPPRSHGLGGDTVVMLSEATATSGIIQQYREVSIRGEAVVEKQLSSANNRFVRKVTMGNSRI